MQRLAILLLLALSGTLWAQTPDPDLAAKIDRMVTMRFDGGKSIREPDLPRYPSSIQDSYKFYRSGTSDGAVVYQMGPDLYIVWATFDGAPASQGYLEAFDAEGTLLGAAYVDNWELHWKPSKDLRWQCSPRPYEAEVRKGPTRSPYYMVVDPVGRWGIEFHFDKAEKVVATWVHFDGQSKLVLQQGGSALYYTLAKTPTRGTWKFEGRRLHIAFPRWNCIALPAPQPEELTRQKRSEIIEAYRKTRGR